MPITPSEEKWLAEVTERVPADRDNGRGGQYFYPYYRGGEGEAWRDITGLLQLVARLKDENDTLHELIKPLQEAAQGRVKPLELVEADMKREERVQELVKAAIEKTWDIENAAVREEIQDALAELENEQ